MKVKIQYILLSTLWGLLSLIPLRVMYILSDGLYYLLYYVARYRRKVTRKNLTECFPEKSMKEIIAVEKKFYRFFGDYIWETCKIFTMSRRTIKKRMVFENIQDVEEVLEQGKSISLYLGHYCNWEWVSSIPIHFTRQYTCGQIYHRLYNKSANKLFLKNRQRFEAENIEMPDTLRWISRQRKAGKATIVGYIADQAPVWNSIHHWVNFLHHDTPAFTGTEKITKKYGFEAYYLDVVREKRGYYRAKFLKMHDNPSSLPDFELTDMYYTYLEKTIRRHPEYYLWSHNRFKRTREEYNRRMKQNS